MTLLQAMKASVTYQGVFIARDVEFLHADTEKAVLAVEEPMPVATELSVEVRHAEGFVKGTGIVTKVQECREPSGKGQLHLRWVEFSDADLERFSSWLAQSKDAVAPSPSPAPASSTAVSEEPAAAVSNAVVPEVTLPMAVSAPEAEAVSETAVAVPQTANDEEPTQQLDLATQVDIPVVNDSAPEQENTESSAEENSSSPGGENGDSDGGDKKKRRRRRK